MAVIGAAGRFPGARSLRALWRLLIEGRAVASDPDEARADLWRASRDPVLGPRLTTLRAGYLAGIAEFDADFFGISPREAARMDPQQRLLLEVTHEAVEDAALTREDLRQGVVGVYVGVGSSDYLTLQSAHKSEIDAYYGVGNSHNLVAGRISYTFNLKGPCLSIDTACSSSLTALHLAAHALESGEADLAIVGGVNVIVAPDLTLSFSQARMLSPSGRCLTFAEGADGYGRAEAVGVVVLRRLDERGTSGRQPRCIVRSTALNQDGRSNGITAPNGQSQEQLIATALTRGGVAASELEYVEAHGTGTPLGDAIEIAALQRVFAGAGTSCTVGSVKANLGHAEAAAGICGVLKAMLMLEHGTIPPHPVPRPHAAALGAPGSVLSIAEAARPFRGGQPCVGVSSFGFGGSNGHAILQRAERPPRSDPSSGPHLFVLSSHFAEGVAQDAAAVADFVSDADAQLDEVSETLVLGRDPRAHRAAFVAQTREEATEALRRIEARPAQSPAARTGEIKLAFAFSGQGTQRPNMGRWLYEGVRAFRGAFDACDDLVKTRSGISAAELLYAGAIDEDGLAADTHRAQLALFTYEYALAQLWLAAGLRPSALIGHSLGELVAHTVAGNLALPDAVALAHERGRLMQRVGGGSMIGVSMSPDEASALVQAIGGEVYIAAVNAARSVVLAGTTAAVEAIAHGLTERKVVFRSLRTKHAFHTPAFRDAAAELSRWADTLTIHTGKIPVVGNLDGRVVERGDLRGTYWGRHIVEPVQFARGVSTLSSLGIHVVLEIGPGHVLSDLVARDHATELRAIASGGRRDDGEAPLLQAAAALYQAGVDPIFAALRGPHRGRIISLPPRSFVRRSYWFEPAPNASQPAARPPVAATTPTAHPPISVPMMPSETPSDALHRTIQSVVGDVARALKQSPEKVDPHMPFADMGADSLILLEVLHELNERHGTSLTVHEVYERVDTIAKVARYMVEHGRGPAVIAATGPFASGPPDATNEGPMPRREAGAGLGPGGSALESLILRQIALMQQQLGLLGAPQPHLAQAFPRGAVSQDPADVRGYALPAGTTGSAEASHASAQAGPATVASSAGGVDRFNAFGSRLEEDDRQGDAQKQSYVRELAERLARKCRKSKAAAEAHRHRLADNRTSAGFRPFLKELVYPIVAERAEGAHIVDVDGNRYVDFTMGFGAHFFGHSPAFVRDAIGHQMACGIPIGPQSPLAGPVADLVAEITGHARVLFCNSGTEATMTAVRLARAKTGKDKIAIFKNSYHGTFDGFIARQRKSGSQPASLGVPASFVHDTVVLDYCDDTALRFIEEHHTVLAAVLVEPVQSRALALRPGPFLQRLRKLTAATGVALIFDEVITGFRLAAGGAQEVFDLRADLCAYGKVLGGGMPIGVVAGSSEYMDAIDGGPWRFGDDSAPTRPTIFFAGTFSKHPLAMAAARAVLTHVKSCGPDPFREVNLRTEKLARDLEAALRTESADVTVASFGSVFRFDSPGNLDVFHLRLREEGYFIWEGRNCFLSTAHSAEDLAGFVEAVRRVARELVEAKLLPSVAPEPARGAGAESQRRFIELASTEPGGDAACNLCFGLRFDRAVDAGRLARAISGALRGPDALSLRFNSPGGVGLGHAAIPSIEHVVVEPAAESSAARVLLDRDQQAPLAPARGENFRARIYAFADGVTVASVCVHHLACDGWALALLFDRIARRYASDGEAADPRVSYARWIEHEQRYLRSDRAGVDRAYWMRAVDRIAEYQRSHAYGPLSHHHEVAARKGARAELAIEGKVVKLLRAQARTDGVTPFTLLLAAFQVLLNRVYGSRLPVIGVPFANRPRRELLQLVGTCVNLLPLLPLHAASASLEQVLAYTKDALRDLFEHAQYPYSHITDAYRAATGSTRTSPVEVTFNVEPLARLPSFDGCQPSLIVAHNARIEFDLMFNLFVLDDEIRIELDYDADRFREERVYGLLNLFAKIVENAAAPKGTAGNRAVGGYQSDGLVRNGSPS